LPALPAQPESRSTSSRRRKPENVITVAVARELARSLWAPVSAV
jgi:hypothetical protein